jgi:hypothetical protein
VWLWAADSPRGHANGQVDSEQDAKDHARRAAVYLAQPQAFRWMSQILAVRSDDVHLISLYRQSLASSFNAGSSDVYRDEMVRRGFAVQPART